MKYHIRNVTKEVVVIAELSITIPPLGLSAVIDEAQFKKVVGPRFDIQFVPVMLEGAAAQEEVVEQSSEVEEAGGEETKRRRGGRHARV